MAARKTIVVALALVAAGAAALIGLPIEDSTTIDNAIVIERPPGAVFTSTSRHPATGRSGIRHRWR